MSDKIPERRSQMYDERYVSTMTGLHSNGDHPNPWTVGWEKDGDPGYTVRSYGNLQARFVFEHDAVAFAQLKSGSRPRRP